MVHFHSVFDTFEFHWSFWSSVLSKATNIWVFGALLKDSLSAVSKTATLWTVSVNPDPLKSAKWSYR